MSNTALRIEVLDAFEALTQQLNELGSAILSDTNLIAWVHNQEDSLARSKTIEVLNQLHYFDEQAPREIILLPGFIGASSETLQLASKTNDSKDRFKKSILALKKANAKNNEKTTSLQKMGLGRLHLKQCYRKIPILNGNPQKISWTWAHTRSITQISLSEAKELLQKKGNDIGIQLQLQKLAQLSQYESLAIVQELAPHLRANIVFSGLAATKRLMIKGPIPIFFPCQVNTPLPQFKPPKIKQGRNENRLIRSDVKLEPTPYLSAIRAHRYVQSKEII